MSKFVDYLKPQNRRILFSFVGILFLFLTIPLTVYVALNVRQFTVPAADNIECQKVEGSRFGVQPSKNKAEDKAKSLFRKNAELKFENSKFSFLKSKKKVGQLAKDRVKLLTETAEQCPNEAVKLVLNSKERNDLKKIAPNDVEKEVVVSGTLQVRHVDFFNTGVSDTEYVVKTDGGKDYELHLANQINVALESRTKINVKGALVGDQILLDASKSVQESKEITGGISVIEQPGNPPVLGDQRTAVIVANFQNKATKSTIDSVNGLFFNNLRNFYLVNSYNKANVTGRVFGPYTLPMNHICPDESNNGLEIIKRSVISTVDPSIDFNQFDRIVIDLPMHFLDGGYCPSWGSIGKEVTDTGEGRKNLSVSWVNSDDDRRLFAFGHEFGHNFGLMHANLWACGLNSVSNSCNKEYADKGSMMGHLPMELNGTNREVLGWLSSNNLKTITESGTYTIEAIEIANENTKVLKIPRYSSNSGKADALFVEYRQPIGLDTSISPEYTQGVLIHTRPLDPIASHLYDASGGFSNSNPALRLGATLTDPISGAKVTLTATNSSSATVSVVLDGSTTVLEDTTYNGPVSNYNTQWNRPSGFAVASSTRKSVDWSDVSYSVDVRCTRGFATTCNGNWNAWNSCGSWPEGKCPPYTTTNTSVRIPVPAGFDFEYRVWIVTKRDGSESAVASYPWKDATRVSSCSSGTCTKTLSWDKAAYKAFLQRQDNGQRACPSSTGCTDGTFANDSKATFLGVPQNTNFKARIEIEDKNRATHLLQILNNVGNSEIYTRTCSSSNSTTCKMPGYPDTNSFIGSQPVSLTVKANSANGPIVSGPTWVTAASDGSLTANWTWSYTVVMFPASNSNCLTVVADCKVSERITNNNATNNYLLGGLVPNKQYTRWVCVADCGNSQAPILRDTVTTTNPVAAALKPVQTTCSNNNVVLTWAWSNPTGPVFDAVYLDVGLNSNTFIGTNVTSQLGNQNPTLTRTVPQNITYYYRVNSRVAGSSFWLSSPVGNTTTPSCVGGISSGIVAEYFDNNDFTNPKITRGESKIDFRWGTASPDSSIQADTFSARINSTAVYENAIYRFILTADENAKVYLNGSSVPFLVTTTPLAPVQAALNLSSGVHNIRVDFVENTGNAQLKLTVYKASVCGDQNGNGLIESGDLLAISRNIGAQGVTPWDVNGDLIVNQKDLDTLAASFNKSCTETSQPPKPEPSKSPLTLRPNSSVMSQWTTQVPNEGAHFSKVSESVSDGDSTYLEATNDNLWSTFGVGSSNIPAGSTIQNVTVHVVAKYVTSSANNIVAPALISAGKRVWADKKITDSYATYSGTWTNDPATGKAWTVAGVDALNFGVRKSYSGAKIRVSQVYMVVTFTPPTN